MPRGLEARLEDYAWPGNVRELQNAIARHVAVGELPEADAQDADAGEAGEADVASDAIDAIERVLSRELPLTRARAEVVEEFERRYVQRVLDRHGGSVSRAAAASGIALRYFQRLKAKRGPTR